MIKSIIALATVAVTLVSAQLPDHIAFTQPVGNGITYAAGSTQTFSWTMACTSPSSLVSATPDATEVDFMNSDNPLNAFFVQKVGTIDCTKGVGNLVWTVPADTKPGVYALQLLLSPNNAYSGRFNVTSSGSTGGTITTANTKSGSGTSLMVSSTVMGITAGAPFDSEVSTADLDSEAFVTTPSATTTTNTTTTTEDMELDMLTQLLDSSNKSSAASEKNCATTSNDPTLLSDPSVIALATISSSSSSTWASSPSISPLVLKLESPLLTNLDGPETTSSTKSKAKGKASSSSSTLTNTRKRSSNPLDKEAKARERVLRNRAAAQESRDKKRKYVSDIEATNESLQEENSQLQKRLKTVESDNLALSQRLEALTEQFAQMQQLLSQSIKQNQQGAGFCQSAVLAKKDKGSRQTEILTNSPQQKLAPQKGSLHSTTSNQAPPNKHRQVYSMTMKNLMSKKEFLNKEARSLDPSLAQNRMETSCRSAATGHSQHGPDDDGVLDQHPATIDAEFFDSYLDLDWSTIAEQSAGAASAAGSSIFYPTALLEPSTI
ncbi:hypothetical protein BGZ46_002090 [Entomortierella lignicola]|nr:hypothetical protein BGZ46_002090 [Entomortierella lignicola]